jgi:hypothetical protein
MCIPATNPLLAPGGGPGASFPVAAAVSLGTPVASGASVPLAHGRNILHY